MFLLAVPMYAAVFVLLSLLCFAVFLAIPRVRRYAAAALVAPVAFGGCAAAGFLSWVLVCAFLLKVEVRPITGPRGFFDVLAFFIAPGLLGSAAAVWVVNKAVRIWWSLPIAPSWKERTSAAEAASSEAI
jgi:hypothetical protein